MQSQMQVDLRSDTVTRPTPEMKEAMFSAPVGDDVYEEDPSINQLQEKIADLFGMDAALFCPSGTMTNQIGIKALTQPQDEVICYKGSHIYKYEGGGLFFNSAISVKLIEAERGKLKPQDVSDNINPDNVHFPLSRLVGLENTVNRGGGACYTVQEIRAIHQAAQTHQLAMHLDGARLFNALVAQNEDPRDYGQLFDTISICLSKGLGCPVGSLLLGSEAVIRKTKRIRKVLGGGMRQAGYLAAAGIYALDHHIHRLAEDHQRAQTIAEHIREKPYVEKILPVDTNIVIFKMADPADIQPFMQHCREQGVLLGTMDRELRIVTHLDFDDTQLEYLLKVMDYYEPVKAAPSPKI